MAFKELLIAFAKDLLIRYSEQLMQIKSWFRRFSNC